MLLRVLTCLPPFAAVVADLFSPVSFSLRFGRSSSRSRAPMEMLRRNLKRQTSCSRSFSPLFVASPADDQENLHPNLAAAPPSLANKPSTPPGLSKPVPSAAAAAVPQLASPQQQQQQRDLASVTDEPAIKVMVRVRPTVSLLVDGKDLFFVRKTSPDSIAVGDRAFAVDGFLDDRASQEDAFCNNGGERGRQRSRPSARPRHI